MPGDQNAEWRRRTAEDARKRQVQRLFHLPTPEGAGSQRCGLRTSVSALPQSKSPVIREEGKGKRRVRLAPSRCLLTVNRVRASGKLKSGGDGDILAARARHRAAAQADDVKPGAERLPAA